MIMMHGLKPLLTAAMCFAQDEQAQADKKAPPVDTIMSRVAANQDRSETALRTQYSSAKHIHIANSKPDGKRMREETTEYDTIPAAETRVQLRSLFGRYWHIGKLEDFKGEPVPEAGSWDADYIRDVRKCLTREQARCLQAHELFLQDGNYLATSYGTEYEPRLLFHIHRTMSISVDTSSRMCIVDAYVPISLNSVFDASPAAKTWREKGQG